MAKKKRRTAVLLVTVSYDPKLTAAEVRREVRTLVNEQSNYLCKVNDGDLRVRKIKPARQRHWEDL